MYCFANIIYKTKHLYFDPLSTNFYGNILYFVGVVLSCFSVQCFIITDPFASVTVTE